MARVMIKCPNTGVLVFTGFVMDEQALQNTLLSNVSFQCPACGMMHGWEKSDAILEKPPKTAQPK